MENWKRAVIFGSLGAGVVLLLSGRRPAAAIAAGVGVAVLASEHPERFRELFENAPDYLERGNRLIGDVTNFLDKLSEQGARLQGVRTGTSNS